MTIKTERIENLNFVACNEFILVVRPSSNRIISYNEIDSLPSVFCRGFVIFQKT